MQATKSRKRELIDNIIDLLPGVPSSRINSRTFWMSEDELKATISMIHEGDRNEFYEMLNS